MGRPYLGPRWAVGLRLDPSLKDPIDAARGLMSRDEWFNRAARLALTPVAQVRDTELLQEVHDEPVQVCPHLTTQLSRTIWVGPERVRLVKCYDCGEEIEG